MNSQRESGKTGDASTRFRARADARAASRGERKQLTRHALLDAALRLSLQGRGFANLSLREVAREAGVVPTAFYRHFRDLDELGAALLDQVFVQLRQLMRQARTTARSLPDLAIRGSVRGFLHYVRNHRRMFEFVLRERSGGSAVMRGAIAREIRYFVQELASDLRQIAPLQHVDDGDLDMIADLVVGAVMNLSLDMLAVPAGQPRLEEEITERGVKQLRLIFLGAVAWRNVARSARDL